MKKSMSLTMQKLSNVQRPSFKFERLLIGYISKFKDRLSISILASISQPYNIPTLVYHLMVSRQKRVHHSTKG